MATRYIADDLLKFIKRHYKEWRWGCTVDVRRVWAEDNKNEKHTISLFAVVVLPSTTFHIIFSRSAFFPRNRRFNPRFDRYYFQLRVIDLLRITEKVFLQKLHCDHPQDLASLFPLFDQILSVVEHQGRLTKSSGNDFDLASVFRQDPVKTKRKDAFRHRHLQFCFRANFGFRGKRRKARKK